MEEDFGTKESFVSHVDAKGLLGNRIDSVELGDPLVGLRVVLGKLFCDVWANVTESLFDCFGRLKRLLRWDANLSFPQQRLDKVGNVPASDGNVLDATANHVTFSLQLNKTNIYINL